MIDTAALRIKILKQAMSGNLSEQKKEDGEAVPKGIVISDSSTDENAYVIPSSWRWVRVKDVVAKDVGGGTPSKVVPEYWDNGDISWATVKDFSNSENGYINETIDHITQEGLENSSANMVDEEAIVVCMRMALGKIVRVSKPMAINQDLRALWLKKFVEQDYFVYFYKTLKVEGRGTTVAGIKKDELMNYAFPVPPVKEQRRIIEKVNSIFNLLDIIDAMQQQYSADLEILKSKIIDAGIQGKLTEQLPEDGTAEELLEQIAKEKKQLIKEKKIKATKALPEITEDEIPFEIPDNWKWVRIQELIEKDLGGGTPSKAVPEYWDNGNIPWASVKDFSAAEGGYLVDTIDHITQEGLENSSANLADEKSIVICMRMGLGKIARVAKPMAINQDLRAIWLNKAVLEDYFVLFYSTLRIEGRGMTVAGIRKDELMSMVFPLPPISEQKRIVEKIQQVMSSIYC